MEIKKMLLWNHPFTCMACWQKLFFKTSKLTLVLRHEGIWIKWLVAHLNQLPTDFKIRTSFRTCFFLTIWLNDTWSISWFFSRFCVTWPYVPVLCLVQNFPSSADFAWVITYGMADGGYNQNCWPKYDPYPQSVL